MTFRNRKRVTAWLGLIGMWLIVFAPVISQLVVAAHANVPPNILCSVVQPVVDHDHHHDPAEHTGACGYCNLLTHHAVMPVTPPAPVDLARVTVTTAVPALSTTFTPLGSFPSGRPRDPPLVS